MTESKIGNLKSKIADALLGGYIKQRVTEATAENDRGWRSLSTGLIDIPASDTRANQLDALEAYRANPLAFRIVELMTDYVLGKGITVTATPKLVNAFLQDFWHHELNQMDARLTRLVTELTIAGEIFVTFHTNPADGMTYIRSIPATLINAIDTNPEDMEDEIAFHQSDALVPVFDGAIHRPQTPNPGPRTPSPAGRWWPRQSDDPTTPIMHHYCINRPLGAKRGQGDLVPILPWLRRYKDWLTDRVIINKYKGAYLWDVTLQGATPSTIKAKQAEIAANPPQSGSIMVHNDSEAWQAIQPTIDASSVRDDGLALRLMLAVGSGTPLHFLSEGSDANLATAKEMGEPTRRRYEHRQLIVKDIVADIVRTAVDRRYNRTPRSYNLDCRFPDLTAADNQSLAGALNTAWPAIQQAVDRGYISFDTGRAWLYKFAEERPPEATAEPEGPNPPDIAASSKQQAVGDAPRGVPASPAAPATAATQ